MKKTSSIILILAMLLTSFMSLFAVGVNAADPGVVAYQNQSYSWVVSYLYDDDATAVANGAIAKFTNINDGKTNYLKEWRTIGAFGAVSGYGCGDTITLISNSTKKISVPSAMSLDAGSRTFTIEGNGITLEGTGRVDINGKDAACVTIKNLKIVNTSANTSAAQFGTTNNNNTQGPKVICDNVEFSAKAPLYATVNVANSDLVLKNGSKISNNGTPAKDSVRCYGIYMMGTLPSLEMIDGSITASGPAIYQNNKGALVIKGGNLTTTNSCCTFATIYSTTGDYEKTIMNATVTAPSGEKAIHLENGKINIDGKGIRNCTINGGVYIFGGTTITNCTITAKGNAVAYEQGATVVNFYDSTVTSENGIALKLNKNDSYPTSAHIFNTNIVSTGAAAISGVETSVCNIYSGSFMGKGDVAAVYVNQADGKEGKVMDFKGSLSDVVDTADLIDGASVRTVKDSSGIRFQSKISKAEYDALIEAYGAANVQFGTIIAPKDKITGVFTKEALGEGNYLDIPAVNGINETEEGYVINAVMTKVKTENYTRDFAAIPYVTVTTDNGTVTAYGTWNEEDNVRNIREVAYKALEDVLYIGKVVDDVTVDAEYIDNAKGYKNKVTSWYENGVLVTAESKGVEFGYTCYSTAQRDVIDDYLA